jgi:F-type H+-transporting ATPase subunit b
MSIIPDPIAVLLNVVPFLIAIMGMYYIILKPMVAYLDERNEAIEGGKNEAAVIEERIVERTNDYDVQLAAARQQIAGLRSDRRAEAQDAYESVIADVRQETEGSIAKAIDEIQAARAGAEATLQQSADELANAVAERVLGREMVGG